MSEAATRKPPVYYITHERNLPSILERGVLSHEKAEALPEKETIYDGEIVHKRKHRRTPEGKTLWEYANFYFQPRNPMLFRVYSCENRDIVVLRLSSEIYNVAKYVAIGNAASHTSEIVGVPEGLKKINSKGMQHILRSQGWGSVSEGKRLIMAELLVPERVSPECIDTVYVPSDKVRDRVGKPRHGLNVASEPSMFFNPESVRELESARPQAEPGTLFTPGAERGLAGASLKLVKGDMFFSRLQTLTISVNTMGVMGGGLAARAKYDFPHLYVKFQDLCRRKSLTTKQPFLYSEPYPYAEHMAYDARDLERSPDDEKQFLLFATKTDWRKPSRLEYIEDGLAWLAENARKRGIKSLAMPALGCGLGGLSWGEVGPVMCRCLRDLGIPCEIYLPREVEIPEEHLTADFLLR